MTTKGIRVESIIYYLPSYFLLFPLVLKTKKHTSYFFVWQVEYFSFSSRKSSEKISKNIESFFFELRFKKLAQLQVCKNYNYTRYHFLRRLRSVSLFASLSPTKTSFLGSQVSSRRNSYPILQSWQRVAVRWPASACAKGNSPL